MVTSITLAVAVLLAAPAPALGQTRGPEISPPNQPHGVIADIQVRGNVVTSDDEMRRIAGIAVGDPVGPGTIAEIAARLRGAKRFERVEVLERFASISDPTQIAVVIVVDEGPVAVDRTGDVHQPARVVRKRDAPMFLPVLRFEDGYGFVYGGRVSLPNAAGKDSRLTFPMTWGGDKRAAAELERDFGGRRTTLSGGVSIDRRKHPYFEQDEDRGRAWARVQREIAPALHVGATGGWQHVSFVGQEDGFAHAGFDATFDTRLDPFTARNAVYGRATWERDMLDDPVSRWELDGRGYVGLLGQSVLVLRVVRDDATGPLPAYLKPMLGGVATVRGFPLGAAIGDRLAAGSAELRVPLNSPLNVARIGVSAFVDAGAVADYGQGLGEQPVKKGVGGSVWMSVAFIRMNVAVAHGVGSTTRVHFEGVVTF